jgi:hypothetical protein
MSETRVPPELGAAVQRDLRPVRPLAPPGRRALLLLPLGLLALAGVPALWGWRSNLSALGAAPSWGLSIVQAVVALWLIGAALRESVPGRELSLRALAATLGAGVLLFVLVTLVTEQVLPTTMPAGVWLRYGWECFGMAALSGVPLVAVAAWLAARALPTRPAVAGALYGLGGGLLADSGVRLFCWVTTPSHVLIAHGAAIAAVVAGGSLAAVVLEQLKARRRS